MIFLNLLNRIFGPKKPLSREEIDKLKSNTASSEMQQKSEDDGFNSEALEGWEAIDSDVNTAMRNIDEKMKKSLNQSVNGKDNRSTYLFLGSFSIVMLVLIIYTYNGNQVNKQTHVTSEIKENSQVNKISKPTESSSNEELFQDKMAAIETYTPIEKSEQITKDQLKGESNTPENLSGNTESEQNEQTITTEIEKLSPKSPEEIPTNSSSNLSYTTVSEVYLNNLKTVDYRSLREEKPIKLLQELPMGTPANQSKRDGELDSDVEQITKEINYIDYLDETQRLFAKESFKRALRRYLIILDHYPDDVNAHFYSGLCYHNLGEYEKAINHFKQSYSLQLGNFKEEAEWFEAKSLLRTNRKEMGKQLLNKIRKEGGFYSEQANELLNSL